MRLAATRLWFDLIAERDSTFGWGLGFNIYAHRHNNGDPWHGHITFTLGPWFVEFRFGYDDEE